MYTTKKLLFQVKGKNFFFPFFIPFKIFIEASNQSCKQSIHRNIYILQTSFPNNDNASIYKPKCDFPMRKTMIFFLSFFRENDTQKRIDPHTSAAQCAAVFNDDSHSIANVCFFLGLNGTVICLISPLLAAPRAPL